jgi:glycosyltransferase involved in cell wall biosynthesis
MTARVSVLTPSFNQACFLEENLASVLAQGGAVLEHIVMDGGSTDGSAELLRRSAGAAARQRGGPALIWASERDGGQADALNKALSAARGDVIGWINSDDLYCDGAVDRALALLDADPGLAMVYGHCQTIDERGRPLGRVDAYAIDLEGMLAYGTIPQPSCFLRRSAIDAAGGLDSSFRYVMDFDLWLRVGLSGARWLAVDETWAKFRLHGASKSVAESGRFLPEVERAIESALFSPSLPPALAARRTELRRRFHTNYAMGAYANLDLGTARAELWRAATIDPLGLDRAALGCAAKALLPLPLVTAARGARAAARSLLRRGAASRP